MPGNDDALVIDLRYHTSFASAVYSAEQNVRPWGRGQVEMAEWAASTAEWAVTNLSERLLPTAFPR
jgi:hypothetical protein